MLFNSFKYFIISSWFSVHLCYMKKSIACLKRLSVFCRDWISKCILMIAILILFIVRAVLILHFFAELSMMSSCSVVWHLAKHCFLIWTLQCNIQGYNSIVSTLLVNYIIRYPFITYLLSDLSQTTWWLGFTSMGFSVGVAALTDFIGLQCCSGRWFLQS